MALRLFSVRPAQPDSGFKKSALATMQMSLESLFWWRRNIAQPGVCFISRSKIKALNTKRVKHHRSSEKIKSLSFPPSFFFFFSSLHRPSGSYLSFLPFSLKHILSFCGPTISLSSACLSSTPTPGAPFRHPRPLLCLQGLRWSGSVSLSLTLN